MSHLEAVSDQPTRRVWTAAEARAVVAGIFAAVAAEKRRLLTAPEATAVMEAYGVPVAPLPFRLRRKVN